MFNKLKQVQPEVAKVLENSIKGDSFSNSSLFCGPKYSAKMTGAIEVAKALSCFNDNKDDECNCSSCNLYDSYLMQNLVIISNRDFDNRIDVACERFVKNRNVFTKNFLIETLRIFLLSYHNAIYLDKNSKLFDVAYQVSDLINEFSKNGENYKIREAQSFVKDLKLKLKPLLAKSNKNLTNLSVDEVRALQIWLSNTLVNEKVRVVIIEAIEKANESVKNSLLKILEEPKKNVYFILLSESPSRIMQTILSRVRRYNFSRIEEDKQKSLLEGFNLEDDKIDSLEKFFLSASGYKASDVEIALNSFVSSFVNRRYLNSEELASYINTLESSKQDEFILEQLIDKIQKEFINNRIDSYTAKKIVQDISILYNNQRVYNLPKKNMYENVYRKMMENINA